MTSSSPDSPLTGRCACGSIRYQLLRSPIVIHCCSCTYCQSESGTAFAVNAMLEEENLKLLSPSSQKPKLCLLPSASGKGQVVARCPRCYVALWSYYTGCGPYVLWLRTGTIGRSSGDAEANGNLDSLLRPDVYIFTKYKPRWVQFPSEGGEGRGKSFEEYYDKDEVWSVEARERYEVSRARTREWEARGEDWGELGDVEDCRG